MSVSNVTSIDTLFAVNIDTPSASLTYIGEAAIASLPSDPVWRIKKLETTGSVLSITWADGNNAFDNIWDNRSSLIYL